MNTNEENQKEKPLNETFLELQQIITKLENNHCSLEESFLLYADGMKLVKECSDAIDRVEKQVIVLEEQ